MSWIKSVGQFVGRWVHSWRRERLVFVIVHFFFFLYLLIWPTVLLLITALHGYFNSKMNRFRGSRFGDRYFCYHLKSKGGTALLTVEVVVMWTREINYQSAYGLHQSDPGIDIVGLPAPLQRSVSRTIQHLGLFSFSAKCGEAAAIFDCGSWYYYNWFHFVSNSHPLPPLSSSL